MDYQSYEDYMRQVLGYTPRTPNIYETYDYRNYGTYEDTYNRNNVNIQLTENEINELYPDIYRLVYPMVCKVCDTNTEPITRELIEKMTNEVYMAIGDTETIVNVRVETKKADNITKNVNTNNIRRTEVKTERTPKREETKEVRNETANRQITQNRSLLRDLIRILILNRIFGGNRPPQRPRPPRPPFPPGGRPPIQPREYNSTEYFKY